MKRTAINCSLMRVPCVIVFLSMLIFDSPCYSKEKDKLSLLQDQLEAALAWSSMSRDEVQVKGPLLVDVLKQITKLKESDVRKIIVQMLAKHIENDPSDYEGRTWSKIFVLNRLYFAVPSSEPKSEDRIFGGWVGVPGNDKTVNLLWPLQKEADGQLRLTGGFGGYMGPGYRALEEFDYFSKKYGIRFSQNKT